MTGAPHSPDIIRAICEAKPHESASQIGRRFGMTPNAVIGIWSRHMAAEERLAAEEIRRQDRRTIRKLTAKPERIRRVTKPKVLARAPEPKPEAIAPKPDEAPVKLRQPRMPPEPAPIVPDQDAPLKAILSLSRDRCRYPHGEGETLQFCAGKASEGKSYCPGHERLCRSTARTPAQLAALQKGRDAATHARRNSLPLTRGGGDA